VLPPQKCGGHLVSQHIPLPMSLENEGHNYEAWILTMVGRHSNFFWPPRLIPQHNDLIVTRLNENLSIELRAPETVIHHSWDEKVDMWVVGCLVRI
jgi:hypothetical protein